MSMTFLDLLRAELDRAAASGRTISVWWRDDDGVRATAALERLIRLAEASEAPLTLAVIPTGIDRSLPERVARAARVTVAPHGWSHANHAPPGEKPAEFGPGRPLDAMAAEAGRARRVVSDAFGPAALDLFAPPWNRIAPALLPRLPEAGYRGWSGFEVSAARPPSPGLVGLATHLDPVDWRGGRGLAPAGALLRMLRSGLADQSRPLGLLTHHLAFDEETWGFTEALLALLFQHPAVAFRSARELLDEVAPAAAPREPLLEAAS